MSAQNKTIMEILTRKRKIPLRAPHAPALAYITKLIDPGAAAGRHPVLCAWCKEEGRRNVLGYAPIKGSHGICRKHAKALLLEYELYIAARGKERLTPVSAPTRASNPGEATITA